VDNEGPTPGRVGGVPCLERWKAFIFASILCGNCCDVCAARRPDMLDGGGAGLRAFCRRPSGVDEAVMDAVP